MVGRELAPRAGDVQQAVSDCAIECKHSEQLTVQTADMNNVLLNFTKIVLLSLKFKCFDLVKYLLRRVFDFYPRTYVKMKSLNSPPPLLLISIFVASRFILGHGTKALKDNSGGVQRNSKRYLSWCFLELSEERPELCIPSSCQQLVEVIRGRIVGVSLYFENTALVFFQLHTYSCVLRPQGFLNNPTGLATVLTVWPLSSVTFVKIREKGKIHYIFTQFNVVGILIKRN